MLSSILLSLAVATATIGASIAPSSRYQPNPIPNRQFMSEYVELLDIQQYFLPNYETGYDNISRLDETTDLLDNYLYMPYQLHVSWNVNGYQIEDINCLCFNINNGPYPDLGMVYSFGTNLNNNVRDFYEMGAVPNSNTQSQLTHIIANSFDVNTAPWWSGTRHYWELSNFIGERLSIYNNEFIDNLEPFFWNQIYLNGIPQSIIDRLKGDSYDEGFRAGKQAGYAEGHQDGIDEAGGASGIVGSLFGGIVSVPLDILNGLSPLVIWNVPIVSIIATLLVVAVLLLIIRKFI